MKLPSLPLDSARRVLDSTAALLRGRPRLLLSATASIAILTFLIAGWLAWFSYDLTANLPDREQMRGLGDMSQSTTIFDRADRPAFTVFKEQRIEVPLDRVAPTMIKAVLSVEDQRFYDHSGVDAFRVAGALMRNLETGRRSEGGSTITQQLARQSYLKPDKTYRRKLKEVILASHIESMYSKDQILELYLNKVYFGDGLYGVEAAARGYFAKSASELTVDEAALLAGLIQSPSSYAPTVNLERAIARRTTVLQTMVASGAIDSATAARAKKAPVKLVNGLEIKETFGLYFKEQVRRDLVERFGWQRVYQSGLRVFTTLDADLQQAAEALLEKGLEDIEKRRGYGHEARAAVAVKGNEKPDYLQGALVSLDPSTGQVLAMVGGRNFYESRFNRAVQAKRQAGSAFKPFVYAAALESGHSPASVISNLDDPIDTPQGAWTPEDEHSGASSMTMRTALRTSSNRAAVQMLQTIGIPSAVGYAQKLNIGTPPSVPSLALGAGDVTLLSMTAAYGAFANQGMVQEPVLIRRVEDSEGRVLYNNPGKSTRAVSDATAFMMTSMLADVINAGTAYRARQTGFVLPAAGKTGTTNDYMDAWFVGYTPKVVTGVWVGFDQPKKIVRGGYAGELAVPIWASIMKVATKGHKPDWFEKPASVTAVNVCRVSGKLPSAGCGSVQVAASDGVVESRSMVYTEYFLKGTVPSTFCPVHESPSFMDRLAGAFGIQNGTPASADAAHLPTPPPASTSGSVPPPAAASSAPPREEPKVEEPKKKRGFWSKLFGRGKDDKDKKDDKQPDARKQEQKKPPSKPPGL